MSHDFSGAGLGASELERAAVRAAEAQLVAYNARDIDAFCAVFTDDVRVRTLGKDEDDIVGMQAYRAVYEPFFRDKPLVRCRVADRVVLGGVVIDTELITDGEGSPVRKAIAIYETRGDQIARITFVKPPA